MKSRKHRLLILMAALTLIGSTAVQVVWVTRGYEQAEMRLEASLKKALVGTISDLHTAENIAFIATVDARGDSTETHEYRYMQTAVTDTSNHMEILPHMQLVDSVLESAGHQISVIRSAGGIQSGAMTQVEVRVETVDGNTFEEEDVELAVAGANYFHWLEEDSLLEEVLEMERSGRLKNVVRRIQHENLLGTKDWKNRIDSASFHEKMQRRLEDQQLPNRFEFAILDDKQQAFEGFATEGYAADLSGPSARLPLFPNDLRVKSIYADVVLPNAGFSVWQEILPMTSLALLFTVLMTGIFIVTLRRLLSQSRLSQLKTDFINNMSHELKTPLATISLAADALTHPESLTNPKAIEGFAQTIRAEQERMNEHIERVLQMAQAERGEFQLDLRETDLADLLRNAIDSVSLMVRESGGEVSLKLPPDPLMVKVDAVHVQAAVSNLIDNALKYTTETPHVELELSQKAQHIVISVQDNGMGIRPEHQELIFSRFFRVQGGDVHTVKGFGLGLSYVANVARAHGGSVSVESPVKGASGSRFTMKFPHA